MYYPHCGNFYEETAVSCGECGNSLGGMSYTLPGDLPYVGFWRRFAAYFIDAVILNILGMFYGPVIGNFFSDSIFSIIFYSFAISTLVATLYFGYFESSKKQATLGKQALGIKVTDLEGNRISFGKAVARYVLKIITSLVLAIGFIAIAFTEKKQGLYDLAVGTVVVYD
ncbi:MAG: RDD domain-containing protein [Methanolobus sp. T82-4]|jgi:uncharacterized RDD family membrane protein YckC|nr:MAG: RDD domain-containing protein [Methanolobus sp. T82-4]